MAKIVLVPNEVLYKKADPVKTFDKKLSDLLSQMEKTLVSARNPSGVGLAAPQIGVSLRVFITKPTPASPIKAYINPEITNRQELLDKPLKEEKKLEGCLSVKNVWGVVCRYNKVEIKYTDRTGKVVKENLQGFPAVIIQHEMDHLDGILFTQRVLEQKGRFYQTIRDTKGHEILDEIRI